MKPGMRSAATGVIRNNIVGRSRDTGVFISTSKNTQIYNNTLEGNFRGLTYFVNCPSIGLGVIGFDLANVVAQDGWASSPMDASRD